MALSISATAGATGASGSSLALTGAAAGAGSILVLAIMAEWESSVGASGSVSTITDTSGLTWAKRFQSQTGGTEPYMDVETWWAYTPDAISSQTVTINFDLPSSTNFDAASVAEIVVEGFTGIAYISTPWDANVSAPAHTYDSGSGNPSTTLSTTSSDTLILGICACPIVPYMAMNTQLGDGYTLGIGVGDTMNVNWAGLCVEYEVVNSSRTAFLVNYTTAIPTWLMVADALSADGGVPPITATISGHARISSSLVAKRKSYASYSTGSHISFSQSAETYRTAISSEASKIKETLSPKTTYHIVSSQAVIFAIANEHFRISRSALLSSAIHISSASSAQYRSVARIFEVAKLHQTLFPNAYYHLTLRDKVAIRSLFALASPTLLHDGVRINDLVKGVYGVLVLGGVRLSSALTGRSNLHALLREVIRLSDALRRFSGLSLSEHAGIHGVLSSGLRYHPVVTEGVRLSSVLGRSLMFSYTMAEGVEIDETDIIKAIYHQTYIEGVRIAAAYISPGSFQSGNFSPGGFTPSGSVTTWAINMRNGAATEYENYNFNSFAKIGNKYIAASQDGLYELNGDTDDGADIIADFAGGYAQFGGSHFASLKAVYLGLRGSGDFVFRLVEGDGTTRDYAVSARDMKTARIDLGKGLRSRYFSWELISSGQDFDLDSIEFVPIILKRRI